tara:strand:- start:244 stop:465 length:222 start_codon:yes stop_codon:yes gene_type:complete
MELNMDDTFRLEVVLRLVCVESEAADDEMEALSDYVSERMARGIGVGAIMQSLAEVLIGLDDMIAESMTETLH